VRNLDQLAAQTAQKIIAETIEHGHDAGDVDRLATKALGVLQEQGVYAATLFLYSRSGAEDKIAPDLRIPLFDLLPDLLMADKNDVPPDDETQNRLHFISKHVTDDLDTLLLVKQAWEQTLIYVRYGAKAYKGQGE